MRRGLQDASKCHLPLCVGPRAGWRMRQIHGIPEYPYVATLGRSDCLLMISLSVFVLTVFIYLVAVTNG